ncbi:MAG: hypothetical protein ACOYOE_12085 [Chlorobium sp.]
MILRGLLQFRSEMHQAGITSGLQWIDGIFLKMSKLRKDVLLAIWMS